MKICKKCNNERDEIKDFRGQRAVCRQCENADATQVYYDKKAKDPDFLKRHAVNERKRRRTGKGCRYALFNRAKSRAKRDGLPFDITLDDIVLLETCPVLGIPLMVSEKMSDCSPSLDRIKPEMGYVKRNVQVISAKANTIKSNATLDELKKVYEYVRDHNA